MDRDRLQQVHESDLTESRVNTEFIDWLKRKGPTWLLVVLIALCAYLLIVRMKQWDVDKVNEAWARATSADTPSALESVATDFDDVGSVGLWARINAARQYMSAVQRNRTLQSMLNVDSALLDLSDVDTTLTEAKRTEYLDKADKLYMEVSEDKRVTSAQDGSAMTLFAVAALEGRAAVAESRGKADEARSFYEQAAAKAESYDIRLADQARSRAKDVEQFAQASTIKFPSRPADGVGDDGNIMGAVTQSRDNETINKPEVGLRRISVDPALSKYIDAAASGS